MAAEFHLDPLWVRLGFVLAAFVHGFGVLLYVLLWLLMPEPADGAVPGRSGFEAMASDLRRLWTEVRGQVGGMGGSRTVAPPSGDSAPTNPAPSGQPVQVSRSSGSLYLGVALIGIGLIALANNAGYVIWEVWWPGILIGIGVLLLVRNASRKT